MTQLLELAPRTVDETIVESDVDFVQTLDASVNDRGRCLITLPKVTFPADC
ncbi:hypothetical protein [Labedaea rhizosphaerae]|uniref:Uncharacterized protein n=1 Tax=Labedaea rhizosphaerae TaxID=598644 RepID=A0A4R6S6B0_LABRH|nr:hypothetical protein [Labedaea rhizosphaerae]TDP94883.1 hypothetical protein EV186_105115 [Labedaea rhizosphaerae]